MLKKISLQALQFTINQALSLDSQVPERLKELDHKVIEMIISPLNVHFYIVIQNGKMLLQTQTDQTPNTVIYSSPMGLIRLSLLPSSKMRSLFNDHIRITGDLELGQELKKIFDTMQIDWEGHLAFFTGDVVAHHIGKVVKRSRAFTHAYGQSFKRSSQEYLTTELACVPSVLEVNQFNQDVDDLRLRVERVAAHIHYLLAKHEIS